MINAIHGIINSAMKLSAATLAYKARVEADGGTVKNLVYTNTVFEVIAAVGSSNIDQWLIAGGGIKINPAGGAITKVYALVGPDVTVAGSPTHGIDSVNSRHSFITASGNTLGNVPISNTPEKYVIWAGRKNAGTNGLIWQITGALGGLDVYYPGTNQLGYNDVNGNSKFASVPDTTLEAPVLVESLVYDSNTNHKLWVNEVEKTLTGPLGVRNFASATLYMTSGALPLIGRTYEAITLKSEPDAGTKTLIRSTIRNHNAIV